MKARHLVAFALAASAALSAGAQTVGGRAPDALQILRRSVAGGARVPIRGQLSVVRWNGDRTVATQAHVAEDGGGRYLLEYDAPRSSHGKVVGFDGKELWKSDARSHTTQVRAVPAAQTGKDGPLLDLLARNYRITLAGKGREAGRPVYVVRLTPRHPGKGSQTRWIDAKTYRLLRSEKRFADGGLAYSMRYTDVELPAKLPAGLFSVPHRPGVHVERSGAGAAPMDAGNVGKRAAQLGLPENGPLGYQLESGSVESGGSFHALYVDGLETVSVFVRHSAPLPTKPPKGWRAISLKDRRAFVSAGRHTNVVTWGRRDLRYAAVSRLSTQALEAFVEAMP